MPVKKSSRKKIYFRTMLRCAILFSIFNIQFSFLAFSQGNSLLWRISGNHLQHPSYLYGTMHSADPRVFHFADSVMPAFEMCDAFAMEVLIDETVQATILQNIFMNGDATLKSLLSLAQYDSLQRFAMKNAGLDVSYFDRMKPLYVAMMLEMMSGDDSILSTADPFLDQYFEISAKKQQKKIWGLETAEEQMSIFEVMTYKDQADLLMKSIRNYSEDTTEFQDMIQSYLNNDLAEMMEFENDFSIPDSLYDALITNRNIRMSARIDSMVRKQSTFIAVGAGHLGGEEGLVSLLRSKGYTVLPVIPTFSHFLPGNKYRFVSIKNNFKVDFPAIPEIKSEEDNGTLVSTYSNKLEKGKPSYEVVVIDYPDVMGEDEIKERFSNFSENHDGKQTKSITVNGVQTNQYLYQQDKMWIAEVTVYDEHRLYNLHVIKDGKIKPEDYDHFFQSFAILAE